MKKLAVLGCGSAAVPILRKAREMGVETHCFALDETPCAKGLSSYFHKISFRDIERVYSECMRIGIDGVIASSEITTESTAILADRLHLPGNRVADGFAGNNKYLMRERVSLTSGVLQPKYCFYRDGMQIKYPAFVKAIDSCGKKGISLVHNETELQNALAYSRETTNSENVLIEEYISGGTEYSIECISNKGDHYIVQITKKDSSGAPHFSELGHHQPGEKDSSKLIAIKNAIPKILTAVGIEIGMSHVEIKVLSDGSVYFIELGARAGGDRIADTLVGLSTNYDYYRGAIEAAINDFKKPKINNTSNAGIYYLCKQTQGLSPLFLKASNEPWCIECYIPQNQLVDKDTNDDGNTSGYLIYRSDHKVGLIDVGVVAERINDRPDAFNLVYEFNIAIGRVIGEEELKNGIHKFLEKGNVIAIVVKNEILALLNVYCNNIETSECYINNVEVKTVYRSMGLSKLLMIKALNVCKESGLKKVALHVAVDNYIAINLYEAYGFVKTNETKNIGDELLVKMVRLIN